MAEINFTNQPVDTMNESYRECKNAEHNCTNKQFMAKNLQVIYCSDTCKDAYNNRKKRKLNLGLSKISDANLNKIIKLMDNNRDACFTESEILAFGIDLSEHDEVIVFDPTNNRVTLRFGDFYLIRTEKDSVRIFTKNKMNDEKRII
jgi:hypothetical protein